MPEIHNLNYVVASYGITFVVIFGYALWVWARIAKAKRQQAELNQNQK
ncbi:MAG: heme exporter protein CcmD [bacterium]|nr:heme exporter protein CcmD [bacterium]